jgi:hypothetical protein
MSDTYTDYALQCKDALGGIQKVYLLPYVEYNETQIKTVGMSLDVFPYSQVYEFEVNGSFTQQTTTDRGNVTFDQGVIIDMPKVYTFYDVNVFVRNDFRVIALDNNGFYTLFGANNGMVCNLTNASGNEKGEFNGFTLTFEGKEEIAGALVPDFDEFFFLDVPGSVFNYDLNFDIIG